MSQPRVTPKNQRRQLNMRHSEAFQEWWKARSQLEPVPSEPYRAFMIDRSLTAKTPGREAWKKRTNRADVIPIDYPPRPPITREGKPIKRKPVPKEVMTEHQKRIEELRRRLRRIGGAMAKKYGAEVPELTIKTGTPIDTSYYRLNTYGLNRLTGQVVKIQGRRPQIQVNFPVGASFKGAEHTFRHEFGHHIDYTQLAKKFGDEAFGEWLKKQKFSAQASPWRTKESLKQERRAWKYAREFAKGDTEQRWKARAYL